MSLAAVLLAGLAGLAGCGDGLEPVPPGSDDDNRAIVSDPVGPTEPASGASALALPVTYVSFVPGTFPDGERVTVTNARAAATFTADLVGGGLDPVQIPAEAGDILAFEVTARSMVSVRFTRQVPRSVAARVVRTEPPAGGRDVPLNSQVRVVFSEPVDPASVTGTTLRLLRGGNLVPGEIEVIDGGLAVGFEAEGGLQSGAGYTLMVGEGILDSDGSPLEAPITAAFTTEVGGEAVGLRFEREPEHGISGMIFRSSVVVVAVDALGRPAAGFTGRITLGLGNNPGGGTLLGTTAAGGQPARFADLRVNAAGSGYTLVASAPSLPSVTSAPFDVVPARDLIVLSNRLRTFPYDLGLFVLSADGHGAARIPVPFWATAPDWSPDGSRIVFQRPAGGIVSWSEPDVKLPDDSLYVVNPDGSGLRSLQVNGESPRWSPDGRRILYSRVLDGAWDIDYTLHVINADGSGVRSLGQKGAGASWSPDGTRIAFSGVVQESGGYPIHVMNADGSRVTNLGVSGYPPVWSPDGRRIAFSRDSMLQGVLVGQNVYVMNADGSGVTNLTARYHDAADPWPDMNRDPDWSPDGSKIVYIRSEDDLIQDYFIHVMNADGSGAVRIPVPAGAPRLDAVAHPSWGPR